MWTVVASWKSPAGVYAQSPSLILLTYRERTRKDATVPPSAPSSWRSWRRCSRRRTTLTCMPGSSWLSGPSSLRPEFRSLLPWSAQIFKSFFTQSSDLCVNGRSLKHVCYWVFVVERFGSRIVEPSGGNGNVTERYKRSGTTLLHMTSLFSLPMTHTRWNPRTFTRNLFLICWYWSI